MLEPKVRPLTARQTEFLRHWDAEDNDDLRRSLQERWPSPMTTVYARKFPCTHCGGEAYEFVRESPGSGLWHLNCFCSEPDCPVPPFNSIPFAPWRGWKIHRGHFSPLARKTHARLNRLDIIVPYNIGGEVVWRRGITSFRTAIQGIVANPKDVRRLAWLQMQHDLRLI